MPRGRNSTFMSENKTLNKEKQKQLNLYSVSLKSRVLSYVFVILAGIVQSLSLYIFILPNKFSPGGVTGIATAIQYMTGLNSGYFIVALNIPLLIAAWVFFSKEYVIKTALSIMLTSTLLIIYPKIGFPQYITDQPILAAVTGGVIGGVAIGTLLRFGGSNGGSEIIAGFFHRKFPHLNITWFLFIFDAGVVLCTAFVIVSEISDFSAILNIIILSIVKMFCSSKMSSYMIEGFNSAIKFEIVTDYPEEISKDIMSTMHRGVTQIKVRGGYTGIEKSILICIVRKRQLGTFQRLLKKYPDTFAYIMHTKEVYGRGFSIPDVPNKVLKKVQETTLDTAMPDAESNQDNN